MKAEIVGQLTASSIAKTALLPGIFPRLKALTKNSFSSLALLIAVLYASVKLLPAGHPYLNAANYGRFGVIDVLIAAFNNLSFKRRNIDQILIFGVILLGIILLFAQAVLFVGLIIFNTAWAQISVTGMFSTPNPANDIAYSMLDQVFGIPGIYGSNFDTINFGGPSPFHAAMHNMFAFYSYALLLLGVLIFLYYFLQTAFETANTGKPFGQRFDTVWTPIRLVVALGLLIPFSFGLNSAQYIVLYAAKYGSSMATNMWLEFNNAIISASGPNAGTPLGYRPMAGEELLIYKDNISGTDNATKTLTLTDDEHLYRRSMLALPRPMDGRSLANSLLMLNACMKLYEEAAREDNPNTSELGAYLVSHRLSSSGTGKDFIGPNDITNTFYEDALEFYEFKDIIIRFGERNVEKYRSYKGNVKPLCGDITIPIKDLGRLNPNDPGSPLSPGQVYQEDLFNYITIYAYPGTGISIKGVPEAFGEYWAELKLPARSQKDNTKDFMTPCLDVPNATTPFGSSIGVQVNQNVACTDSPNPDGNFYNFVTEIVNSDLAIAYQKLYASALGVDLPSPVPGYADITYEGIDVSMSSTILDRGWAGAAIWYNKIAQMNGMVVTSANSIPVMSQPPAIMSEVQEIRQQEHQANDVDEAFNPVITSPDTGTRVVFPNDEVKMHIATALSDLYYLSGEKAEAGDTPVSNVNFVIKMINFMLGTDGIYTMRDNVQVHPLAQLSALGSSMINAAIRNLVISVGVSGVGGLLGVWHEKFGQGLTALSGFFSAFFSIGITAGVILYYIIPFFPFMFFFFAMVSWVKTIFEAMVGVPLWALAHLRLEGEGIVGQAASNGYYLILDIFIRPVCILFGLLAASIIFFTEVYLLHILYDLVVENLAGADDSCIGLTQPGGGFERGACKVMGSGLIENARSQLDGFFFTVIYTIIVYMMANSTFKLIDSIPNSILRWIGSSEKTYSDNAGDPTENLTRNAGIAGAIMGREIGSSMSEGAAGAGRALGSTLESTNAFGLGRRGG